MPRLPRRILVVCCLVATPALVLSIGPRSPGTGSARGHSATPAQTVIHLPDWTGPGRLAITGDGSMWMTEEYAGLLRRGPDGETETFLDADDEYVRDMVRGPDGALWAAASRDVVRIDASGRVRRWPVGGFAEAEAITTAGDAVWFTNSGNPDEARRPAIERLSADGSRQAFTDPMLRGWVAFAGLAAATDGSVWFTEADDPRSRIGRMTPDGRFSTWRLPEALGEPGRIVGGSDGAMWFSAEHTIGRITPAGEITQFPLRDGLAAADLMARGDGALWFASDVCVGRMTTAGEVTTWPVPGARKLTGMAEAPDGTLWLADQLGNAIRRFTPSAAPAAPCGAPSLTRRAGPTTATVSYRPLGRYSRVDYFTDIGMRIAREGSPVFSEAVPGLRRNDAFSDSRSLAVRDLDGDDEPEVVLLLNWHGAHCCYWSRVYRYDGGRRAYVPRNHFWGNAGAEPKLRDLDDDGRPELVSIDDRFGEVFSSSAGSARPLQIWSYRRGDFRDVTRRCPALVRRDARRLWRLYVRTRGRTARSVLPAWMATQYLLGRAAIADRVLEQERRRGHLGRRPGIYGPRDPRAYVRAVKALLRKTGYT